MKTIAALAAMLVLGTSGIAAASVPGWAHKQRVMHIEVPDCATFLANAFQSATGRTASVSQLDAFTMEVRGFTSNEGFFGLCTASANKVCNTQAAALTLVVFSSAGSSAAVALRDSIDSKVGDPRYFDCP
jgi:hypothetical protein